VYSWVSLRAAYRLAYAQFWEGVVVPKLVLVILRLGVSFLGLSLWAACYTGYCYVLGNLLCSGSSIKVAP
jgi:hypothetical protein